MQQQQRTSAISEYVMQLVIRGPQDEATVRVHIICTRVEMIRACPYMICCDFSAGDSSSTGCSVRMIALKYAGQP